MDASPWREELWFRGAIRFAVLVLPCAWALALSPTAAFAQAADFTLVALPDTQYYTCDSGSASCANDLGIFASQTSWIDANRDSLDIRFVTLLGDCAQNGNIASEYEIADAAFQTVEAATSPDHPDGLPFGIAVGNHDQFPTADPGSIPSIGDVNHPDQATTTTTYNAYFGIDRFCPASACRSYYGDHFGINNDNHYQLWSANGYEFIVVHIEYMSSNTALREAVIAWANGVLSAHSDRRAIVVTHYVLNSSANFGNQGSALYEGLKGNPNLFLMLAGHIDGESRRSDTFEGNTVHSLLSDYQNRSNGGNGWLRVLTFQPSQNRISVQTYSPFLDAFETDGSSEFTIGYDMSGGFPGAETETAVFQQGADGYTGTVDSYIQVSTAAHGDEDHLFWDGSPLKYALLRFENLFSSNGGSIPAGATVTSATLDYVADDNGNAADVHAISIDWAETVDYANFGASPGAQAGEDYAPTSLGQASGNAPGASRTEHSLDVTAAVAAWSADPGGNHGLIFVPTGNSGTGLRSSEYAVSADRPRLSVRYLSSGCVLDADCNDSLACTADACVGGVCENVATLGCCASDAECADANECTVDSCDLGTNTCESAPTSPGSPCGNPGDECTNADTCDGGGACTQNGFAESGQACGDASATQCDEADSCDGAGACQANRIAPGTACGDPSVAVCNAADSCDGAGTCQPNLAVPGSPCDDLGDECTNADSCDAAGACTDNGFVAASVACGGASVSECDAADSCDGAGTCQANPLPIDTPCGTTGDLVSIGSNWLYLDDGSDQGSAWRAPAFADGGWASGPAQLGYGDQDEATVVDGGPSNARHITTYFRTHFGVIDPAATATLSLRILRDDGAVAYLNGSEVYRGNMPGGSIGFDTTASSAVGGAAESTFDSIAVSPTLLVAGDNVLAVEIHQANSTSSDISFDLELVGVIDPVGSVCNGVDSCDGAGACGANLAAFGAPCGDPTAGACNGADGCDGAGACLANLAAPGASCGDPASGDCNGADSCDAAGTCLPNLAEPGTSCGDPASSDCNGADSCDTAGSCLPNLAAPGATCGNPGDSCTDPDSCDDGGSCSVGLPLDCDDGDECTADACDQLMGCSNTPISNCNVAVPAASRGGDALIALMLLASAFVAFQGWRPRSS